MKATYQAAADCIMPTYKRAPLVLERGVGACMYDANGKQYLDFIGGIATCTVGHAHAGVIQALAAQAQQLINATNLYYTRPQIQLAQRLSTWAGFKTKAFFSNSGAESVEAALKLARKHTGKAGIIAAQGGFHGRTFGALAATWKQGYKKPFAPCLPEVKHVPYNNPKVLERAVSSGTAAFIVEPIQGEEGVITPDPGYLAAVSTICKNEGVLLIVDEVQTAMGRTGTFFAFQSEEVRPDIITMAKGLANGIPIGVTLAHPEIADSFAPGDHGSTFGGNSLVCKAALAVLDCIDNDGLLENVRTMGAYFMDGLQSLVRTYPCAVEVRGRGLMLGLQVSDQATRIVDLCRDQGLLVNCCGDNTVRFLPPLIVTRKEIDCCLHILERVLHGVSL